MIRSFDRSPIDQQLQALEADLELFKQRYHGFVLDWERYGQVQAELAHSELAHSELANSELANGMEGDREDGNASAEPKPMTEQTLALECDRLRQELQTLEARLEAQLFSWNGFGTVFWQVVRFLGLGLILGWGLRGCAG